MKITRKRRHEAMLEQGMHSGNTDAKFDPPLKPLYHCAACGRLSTKLSSYRSVGALFYCASHPTPTRKTPDRFASIAGGRL